MFNAKSKVTIALVSKEGDKLVTFKRGVLFGSLNTKEVSKHINLLIFVHCNGNLYVDNCKYSI